MSIGYYRDKYISYYRNFLDKIFGSNSVQQPTDRYAAAFQFILPWVRRDNLWRVSKGVTVDQFTEDAEFTIAYH
jgi:hypothetical protein